VTVILLVLAVVTSMGHLPTAARGNESSKPAPKAVESQSSTNGVPAPPF
jgi:hypothetical protein